MNEIIATILNRRKEIISACLGAAHAVDVAKNNFFALYLCGSYAPLDWDVDPIPLPIPELVGMTVNGEQYPADGETTMPEPYTAIPENFVDALRHLAGSPLLHFCRSITFDKTMGRIEFSNGDSLLYRNYSRPTWLPPAVTIEPQSLKLLSNK